MCQNIISITYQRFRFSEHSLGILNRKSNSLIFYRPWATMVPSPPTFESSKRGLFVDHGWINKKTKKNMIYTNYELRNSPKSKYINVLFSIIHSRLTKANKQRYFTKAIRQCGSLVYGIGGKVSFCYRVPTKYQVTSLPSFKNNQVRKCYFIPSFQNNWNFCILPSRTLPSFRGSTQLIGIGNFCLFCAHKQKKSRCKNIYFFKKRSYDYNYISHAIAP